MGDAAQIGKTKAGFVWPEGAYALRLILAAFISFALAQLLPGGHGYSAVFSAIIVTRPYSQGAIKAGLLRLLATAAGILMAFVAVGLRNTGLNEYELLLLALTPLSILAAYDSSYRTALISALIMLSAPIAKVPEVDVAVARALVVCLGAVVGVVVSLIVLPQKHELVTGRQAARAVRLLLEQLRASLATEPDLRRAEKGDRQVRKILLDIGQVARDRVTGKRAEHDSARIIGLTRHIQSLCLLLRVQWRTDMTEPERGARDEVCSRLLALAAFGGGDVKAVIGVIRALPALVNAEAPETWLLESVARDLVALDKMIA